MHIVIECSNPGSFFETLAEALSTPEKTTPAPAESTASEKAFLAENAELIRGVKQSLKTLCADIAATNDILKNNADYPAFKVSAQLATLTRGILSTRIAINALDAAAKSKGVTTYDLAAFKDSLAKAQDYFNEAVEDFYMLTSGADLSDAEEKLINPTPCS